MPPVVASTIVKGGKKRIKRTLHAKTGKPVSHAHGVRNAMVRYRDSIEGRSLAGTIGRHNYLKQKGPRSARSTRQASNEISYNARMQEVYARAQELYMNSGEEIEERDLKETVVINMNAPDAVHFPFIILSLAVLKDLLDILTTLSIVGIPFSIALSVVITLILFFWTLGKMSGGWWKKKLVRWMLTWLIIAFLGEATPFLQVLPIATIFVLMAHYREKKVVKLFNQVLEELHKAKLT